MKAVIQKVIQASVTVSGETVSSIQQGLCVLIGISRFDTVKEMDLIILKGNKLDFHEAMGTEMSKEFYDKFLEKMGRSYNAGKIKDGKFGALMQVNIQNDGPVTIEVNYPPTRPEK